ncbi:MAG: hypothetical protein ACKVOR_08550 [Flavobacteriales bacterium]
MHAQITIADYEREVRCNVNDLAMLVPVTATSDAGGLVTEVFEQTFSGGCMGTLVRTYVFRDKLDNEATAEQYIYLNDTTAPLLIGIPDATTAKAGEVPPPPHVECVDNSGRLYLVYFSEAKSEKEIIRTWTCTDDCGNVSTAKQVITLVK